MHDAAPNSPVNRRAVLAKALRLGLVAAISPAVLASSGCGSRTRAKGYLGDPIPADPEMMAVSSPVTVATRPTPNWSDPIAAPTNIQPRRLWTSGSPKRWLADPMRGIQRVTVHHDGIYPMPSSDTASVARRIEAIRQGHLARGWADIGYHYVIDPAGRVWEGRPLHLQGAHVKYNNEHNLGIMLLGNFDRQRPTQRALDALDGLVASEMRRYRVPMNRLKTHQEIRATACPGLNLQAHMNTARANGGRLSIG